jgi:hypothetical protein
MLAVLMQVNSGYKGFLGYAPGGLHVLSLVQALCDFYNLPLPPTTTFFLHLEGLCIDTHEFSRFTVG